MKLRTVYTCQQCGYESPRWMGKCPQCESWNSFVENVQEAPSKSRGKRSSPSSPPPAASTLKDVKHIEADRLKSGLSEFDRVMGGGIVHGSVTLLAGDPGIGKSTLLLTILGKIGGFYVSAEESAEQVKLRAQRTGISGDNITILPTTSVDHILAALDTWRNENGNGIVIIDSIQTIATDELEGMPGSVGQIRRSGELLTQYAKRMGIPLMIVGHVTKQGTIAGPKVLEHMVDTVLYLEGERFINARILRTLKNRFGAVEEVGIFEMRDKGLIQIDNPSDLFLGERKQNVPGSIITALMEGTRPILVEIQALVVPSQLAIPRRVASGVDINRLQLLIAVLQKHARLPLGGSDIFVNVSGGLKVSEPAADLAIALAIASSFHNKGIGEGTVAFGEVGLLGEVRRISGQDRRVKEAKRLGYANIITTETAGTIGESLKELKK